MAEMRCAALLIAVQDQPNTLEPKQTIQLQPARRTSFARQITRAPLRALALYDGLISLVYVRELLQSLTTMITPALPVQSSLWSFDMLTSRDLRDSSERAADGVDLLIVAGSRTSPLPAQVKSWLTTAVRKNGKAPVILAIYEEEQEPGDAVSAMRQDLGEIAARWHTPLLCNTECDECLEACALPELAAPRMPSRTCSSSLGHPPRTLPVRYYGIND